MTDADDNKYTKRRRAPPRFYGQYGTAPLFSNRILAHARGWPLLLIILLSSTLLFALLHWQPFRAADDSTWAAVRRWAAIHGIRVSNKLSVQTVARRGVAHRVRGVTANEELMADEQLLWLPIERVLFNSTARVHALRNEYEWLFAPVHEEMACDACERMAFVISSERSKAEQSDYAAYWPSLRLTHAVRMQHPMLMNAYQLQRVPRVLRVYVNEARRAMRVCFESVRAARPPSAPPLSIAYHAYVDAVLECRAHHFGLLERRVSPRRLLALLPLADLFNAAESGRAGNVRLRQVPGEAVVIETTRLVRRGEELSANWFPSGLCAERQQIDFGYIFEETVKNCTL